MSKPSISPYRRNIYNNKPTISPYKDDQPAKLAQKSKLSHSFIADPNNTDKKLINGREDISRPTDKKRNYQYAPVVGPSRLDVLVQQNRFLLAENNELTNLLNDRSRIIIALEQKLEQQISQQVQTLEQIEYQKNRFLQQYSIKMREHSARNECLMDEIAQLNQDIYQLQLKKNRQIQQIKQNYSRQHKSQLENILNNHAETVELMSIQNSKLKDTINNRDHQIQCLNHELKSTQQKLKSKTEQLQKNLAHALHMKKLQLSEQKLQFEKIIQNIKRQNEKVQQINTAQYEQELKRVRRQALAKQIQIDKLGNDISSHQIDSNLKINELYQKKGELENQISQLELFQKQLMFDQAERLKNLTQNEINNNDNMYNQLIENLKSENKKLKELNQARGVQINKLYDQINELKYKNDTECEDLRIQIQNLKALVHNQRQSYDQQNEALKTKIANLRHADINSLQQYYQNELATLMQDLKTKEQIIQQNRDKLHHQLQQKTQIRKNFEMQISKLNIKIGQLQLKIANILHQRKQDIANIGSQMELTSMNLLRTAEEKEKYAAFSQTEKQRLQKIIEGKDRQIDELNDKMRLMGANHQRQIFNKNDQIKILKKTIQELEINLKKEKYFLESEIRKKQAINKNDREFYESQIARVKKQTTEEFNKILTDMSNQKAMIDAERIRLRQIQKQLKDQLNQINGFREQQNIDKEVTINESLQRHVNDKQVLEEKLKAYYNKQLITKDNEIRDLRQQISQLNRDIRSHIEKQQRLEEKLQKLLESQQKLRDMQHRVLALGQQNNLVKNLSQIVKNRRK